MNDLRRVMAMASLAALACIAGCGEQQAAKPGTHAIAAVVDLDRVAAEIGVNAKYQEYINGYRSQLKEKLESIQVPLQQDLERLQNELRTKLDAIPEAERKKPDWKAPAEAESAYKKVVEKQQQIQAEGQNLEAKLQSYDRAMKEAFQAAIQPAVAAVCEARGVRVMVPRAVTVYFDPDADLTAALIGYLKAHPIQPPPPPPNDL